MTYEEMLFQLKDLKHDKEKYIDKDDPDDIIKKDADALELAIICLDTESQRLKEYKNDMNESMLNLYKEMILLYKELLKR